MRTLDIRARYIYDSYDAKIARSFIFGYEIDDPSSKYLRFSIFNTEDLPHNFTETVYTENLQYAKSYFKSKLESMSLDDVEVILKRLTLQFNYNIYYISDELDVHVSFETMNNRGRPLSHLELLKNRLIYLSSKLDIGQKDKNSLRLEINSAWTEIYTQLGRKAQIKLQDDTFLAVHYALYFNKEVSLDDIEEIPLQSVHKVRTFKRRTHYDILLKDIFTIDSLKEGKIDIDTIHKYVKSLKQSIEKWFYIQNPDKSDYRGDPEIR